MKFLNLPDQFYFEGPVNRTFDLGRLIRTIRQTDTAPVPPEK